MNARFSSGKLFIALLVGGSLLATSPPSFADNRDHRRYDAPRHAQKHKHYSGKHHYQRHHYKHSKHDYKRSKHYPHKRAPKLASKHYRSATRGIHPYHLSRAPKMAPRHPKAHDYYAH